LHQNVPCGHHVEFKVNLMQDVTLRRSYTPVLESLDISDDTKASRYLHFLIKTYADGAVTKYLNQLEIGSELFVSDTEGSFDRMILKNICHLIVIYAGTGFTPMVKVIREFLAHIEKSSVESSLTILSFNKTEKDIIWKDQIESLEKRASQMKNLLVNIQHTLSEDADQQAGYNHGRISKDLIRNMLTENLQKPFEATESKLNSRLCCVCGPILFNREAKQIFEKDFCYDSEELHVFEG